MMKMCQPKEGLLGPVLQLPPAQHASTTALLIADTTISTSTTISTVQLLHHQAQGKQGSTSMCLIPAMPLPAPILCTTSTAVRTLSLASIPATGVLIQDHSMWGSPHKALLYRSCPEVSTVYLLLTHTTTFSMR